MNPQEILAFFRDISGFSERQIDDNDAYDFMNRVYRDFWIDIVDLDKNYWRDTWTTDSVANRNEYKLKQPNDWATDRADKRGMEKIENVSVKMDSTDTEFKLCKVKDYDYLWRNIEYFENHQSQDDPFVIISDESVFIYPIPDETIPDGIELQGIRSPFTLDATTTSSLDILVPKGHREVIAIWMKYRAYSKRMLLNEKNDALNEYNLAKKEALKQLSTRLVTPIYRKDAQDLSNYE